MSLPLTQLQALNAVVQIRALNAVVIDGASDVATLDLAQAALLALSKCPEWASCTVDGNTLAIVMRDLTRFFDNDSTLEPDEPHYLTLLAVEAVELLQAQYDKFPPTPRALSDFIAQVTGALDAEGDWINTLYHATEAGHERLTHLLRRHRG